MTEYQGQDRRRGGPDRRTQSFERVRIRLIDRPQLLALVHSVQNPACKGTRR